MPTPIPPEVREAWIATAAAIAGDAASRAFALGMDLGRLEAKIGPKAFAREMERVMESMKFWALVFADKS